MPLLKKGIISPGIEGLDFSKPAFLLSPSSGRVQNMRYHRGEMRKRYGKSAYGAAAISGYQVMGLGKFEDMSSGTQQLLRASRTDLEAYNAVAGTWASIIATAFTGGEDDFFSFANVTESRIVTISNGVDRIRKWNGSGNATLLGGNPPLSKYQAYLSPYLLLANVTESGDVQPTKVRWCDTGNPEIWDSGNADEALCGNDPSPIRQILTLDRYAAIYKRDSLWIGRPDAFDIFDFQCEKTGIGLAGPRCVADVAGIHYFMSLSESSIDFHRWNGGIPEPFGNAVRDEIAGKIATNYLQHCFAIHVPHYNEVWFFIVVAGNTWPTLIYKFNYRTGFWYMDTCSQITAAIIWKATNSITWDEMSGAWDNLAATWDEMTVSGDYELILGDSSGYTLKEDILQLNDNGTAIDSYVETPDFIGDDLERMERWLRCDVWAAGIGKLYVDYSTDEGSSWTNLPFDSTTAYATLSLTYTKFEFYIDIVSEKVRFRVRNAISGETFYLRALYGWYLSREVKIA